MSDQKKSLLSDKVRLAIILVVAGIGVGAYSFYDFYTGERQALDAVRQARQADLDKLKGELNRVKGFAENIQTIKQEFRELNLQLEAVLEYMPRSYNLAAFLRKINMLAQNSGIEIITFKPNKDEQREGFYSSTSLGISLKGTFTQTLVFFDQLSHLKRIVGFGGIRMAGESGSGKSGPINLSTTLTLRTFRLAE